MSFCRERINLLEICFLNAVQSRKEPFDDSNRLLSFVNHINNNNYNNNNIVLSNRVYLEPNSNLEVLKCFGQLEKIERVTTRRQRNTSIDSTRVRDPVRPGAPRRGRFSGDRGSTRCPTGLCSMLLCRLLQSSDHDISGRRSVSLCDVPPSLHGKC